MSDLPTIYQICQGRSPSLDLTNLSTAGKEISGFLSESSIDLEGLKERIKSISLENLDERFNMPPSLENKIKSKPEREKLKTSPSKNKSPSVQKTKKASPTKQVIGKLSPLKNVNIGNVNKDYGKRELNRNVKTINSNKDYDKRIKVKEEIEPKENVCCSSKDQGKQF